MNVVHVPRPPFRPRACRRERMGLERTLFLLNMCRNVTCTLELHMFRYYSYNEKASAVKYMCAPLIVEGLDRLVMLRATP